MALESSAITMKTHSALRFRIAFRTLKTIDFGAIQQGPNSPDISLLDPENEGRACVARLSRIRLPTE